MLQFIGVAESLHTKDCGEALHTHCILIEGFRKAISDDSLKSSKYILEKQGLLRNNLLEHGRYHGRFEGRCHIPSLICPSSLADFVLDRSKAGDRTPTILYCLARSALMCARHSYWAVVDRIAFARTCSSSNNSSSFEAKSKVSHCATRSPLVPHLDA
jgi:hypothetical protein